MSQLGIDISEFNEEINFEAIKDEVDFVIIRVGYGTTMDAYFERNYQACKRLAIPCGIYHYSYALNEAEAIDEANQCLKWIEGKKFEYPVYLDMEDADHYKANHNITTTNQIVAISTAYLKQIESNHYFVGIYASKSWFDDQLNSPLINAYSKWIANWGNNDGTIQFDYEQIAGMLQFTSRGNINGIKGDVDRNIAYQDFMTIITEGGFNGYEKNASSLNYQIGDHVMFNSCYQSAMAKIGWPPVGEALVPLIHQGTITQIYQGTNNPYLINDGMCFVNEGDIIGYSEKIKTKYQIGDHVMFNSCYQSSTAKIGWPPVGEAVVPLIHHGIITHIYDGKNNPYLIDNGMAFVNDGDIVGYYQQQSYTVKADDTLEAIAKKFNTTVELLVENNDIQDPNLIYPGQVLVI